MAGTVRKRTWTTRKGEVKTAWVADYTDQDGKRHIKTFPTRKAADRWLIGARREVQEGIHTPDSASVTVTEAARLWLARGKLEKLEQSTLRQYATHVDLHIEPLIGELRLARLSTPAVEGFRDGLLTKSSRIMARKVLTSLKSILSEAQRRGLVAQNVALPVRVDVKKRQHRKLVIGRDIPTKEEVQTLLAAAEGRWRPLFVTAVFTGMRASELRGLRWEDVDLKRGELSVRQRATLWGAIGAPKSAAGERDIPMAPMVVKALREWRLVCPRGAQGLVFPNGNGNVESHANIVNRGFNPLQIACGLRSRYGLHSLRHFFASWAIEQGFSPKRLQSLLGHSSIQMTFDVYGHLFPSPEDDRSKFAAGERAITG